jgi:hypothetical protein
VQLSVKNDVARLNVGVQLILADTARFPRDSVVKAQQLPEELHLFDVLRRKLQVAAIE